MARSAARRPAPLALLALALLLAALRGAGEGFLAGGPRAPRAAGRASGLGLRALAPLLEPTPVRAAAGEAPAKTVIIGGGPAGLATAISLARRGYTNVHVYDRLSAPPDPDDDGIWSDTARFYLIGLGGRGQKALQDIDAWAEVKKYSTSVVGRMDWPPGAPADGGVERIFTDRPYRTEVLARDRLVGVLAKRLREQHGDAVTVHYGVECDKVSWGTDASGADQATLRMQRCQPGAAAAQARSGPGQEEGCDVEGEPFEETTPFLVGADGAARSIADALEAEEKQSLPLWSRRFRVTRYADDNVRIYKTVPMKLPKGWRGDLNYSSRTKDGRVNFDALPADADGNFCGVLLLRENDPLARPDTSPEELRAMFDELLPQFSPLLSDEVIQAVAKKPVSRLPSFRFVGPRLHKDGSTALLGDAVHTVKPYFGLGANSALEDVTVLGRLLDRRGDAVPEALKGFTEERAGEAEALVRLSRGFDRPGFLGFLSFVLPLILDSIFNKVAPRVFGQNSIAMLQRADLTFRGVVWRKRKDRALQATVLAAFLGLAGAAATSAVRGLLLLSKAAPAQARLIAAAGLAGVAFAAVRRMVRRSEHMAPADLLAKPEAKASGANNEAFLLKAEAQGKGADA